MAPVDSDDDGSEDAGAEVVSDDDASEAYSEDAPPSSHASSYSSVGSGSRSRSYSSHSRRSSSAGSSYSRDSEAPADGGNAEVAADKVEQTEHSAGAANHAGQDEPRVQSKQQPVPVVAGAAEQQTAFVSEVLPEVYWRTGISHPAP
eukprot:TRINITY_DN34663_c0_g1_i3.p1 TRINITY_DN34663_c0_g1~~TRINITY_DN34663_c0_g1_i3.p1  ORF type:complete len:168 (+),score=17.64 TRINITY_DN34663_c0_g1_i3:66-506(+)